MRYARCGLILCVATMALVSSVALEAAEPMLQSETSQAAAPAAEVCAAAPGSAPMKIFGMQVFIDPETGLVRAPSPDEAAALSAEMQRQFGATAPRTKAMSGPVVRADGIVMAQVDISLMHSSVAHILPDGTVSFDCVKEHDHGLDDAEFSPAGAEKE